MNPKTPDEDLVGKRVRPKS